MSREDVIAKILAARPFWERFQVRSLSLFGSVARGEPGEASDVDVLVEFDAPVTFDRYMGLKLCLEDALGIRVDLATLKALKPRLRAAVVREALRVA